MLIDFLIGGSSAIISRTLTAPVELFKIQRQEKYQQVFEARCGFITNLSIIDLLFNLGPESRDYLHHLDISVQI